MVDLESEISTPSLEKSEIGHRGVNVTQNCDNFGSFDGKGMIVTP